MRVIHGDVDLALGPEDRLWFGRGGDAPLRLQCGEDDLTVSRRAGELVFDVMGWRVTNVGRRTFSVVQRGGEQEVVPWQDGVEGVLIVGADAWIRIPCTAGDLAVVLETSAAERPPVQLLAHDGGSAGSTIQERPVELTDNELRSVVAISAGYLELPPRYRPEPNSYRAAAHRLGVEEGKVRADLRRVREKVGRAGGPEVEGSRRRDALVQWLVSREVIRRHHLDLLG